MSIGELCAIVLLSLFVIPIVLAGIIKAWLILWAVILGDL